MNRKITILLIIISIFLVGCSKDPKLNENKNKPEFFTKIYEDTNEIKNDYDSYTYLLRKFKSTKDSINMKFKSFSGNESIVILNTIDDGYLDIDHNINLNNGHFKLVLVDPFKNVKTIFEVKDNENIDIDKNIHISLKDGKSRLKIVGSEANGNIQLSFKTNSNISIVE